MLEIRDEDRRLALVRRGNDALWHPERLLVADYKIWKACIDDLLEERGIRVYTGFLADNMTSRARAWTARSFGVGDGLENAPVEVWCPVYTEEPRHVVEIPFHRRDGTLQLKYVFRVRFRWSIEMQASIAIARWYRKMRLRRSEVRAWAEARARSFARVFPGYNMGRIDNLFGETVDLLMAVYEGREPS